MNMDHLSHSFVSFTAAFALFVSGFALVSGMLGLEPRLENTFAQIMVTQMMASADVATSTIQPPPPPLPPPAHDTSTTLLGSTTPPTLPRGIHCPTFTSTLQRGVHDASTTGEVHELQSFLADHFNLNKDDVVSGFFGSTTQGLVRRFQHEQNLPSFGIAGGMTRSAMAKQCFSDGGMRGDEMHRTGSSTGTTTAPRFPHGDERRPIGTTTIGLPPHIPEGDDMRQVGSTTGSTTGAMHVVQPLMPVRSGGDRPHDVDLKVNGSDGPVRLADQQTITVSWTASNSYAYCQVSGSITDETGAHVMSNLPISGTDTVSAWIPMAGGVALRGIELLCTNIATGVVGRDFVEVHVSSTSSFLSDGVSNVASVIDSVGSQASEMLAQLLNSIFGEPIPQTASVDLSIVPNAPLPDLSTAGSDRQDAVSGVLSAAGDLGGGAAQFLNDYLTFVGL